MESLFFPSPPAQTIGASTGLQVPVASSLPAPNDPLPEVAPESTRPAFDTYTNTLAFKEASACIERRDFGSLEQLTNRRDMTLGEKAKLFGALSQVAYSPSAMEEDYRKFVTRLPEASSFDDEMNLVSGLAVPSASPRNIDFQVLGNGKDMVLLAALNSVQNAEGKSRVGTSLVRCTPARQQVIPLPFEFDTTSSRVLSVGEDHALVITKAGADLVIGRVPWEGSLDVVRVKLDKEELHCWDIKAQEVWALNKANGVIRTVPLFEDKPQSEVGHLSGGLPPGTVTKFAVRGPGEVWVATSDPKHPLWCLDLDQNTDPVAKLNRSEDLDFTDQVSSLVLAPETNRVFTTDSTGRLFQVTREDQRLQVLPFEKTGKEKDGETPTLQVSDDGTLVALALNWSGHMALWSTKSRGLVIRYPAPFHVQRIAFCRDNRVLLLHEDPATRVDGKLTATFVDYLILKGTPVTKVQAGDLVRVHALKAALGRHSHQLEAFEHLVADQLGINATPWEACNGLE